MTERLTSNWRRDWRRMDKEEKRKVEVWLELCLMRKNKRAISMLLQAKGFLSLGLRNRKPRSLTWKLLSTPNTQMTQNWLKQWSNQWDKASKKTSKFPKNLTVQPTLQPWLLYSCECPTVQNCRGDSYLKIKWKTWLLLHRRVRRKVRSFNSKLVFLKEYWRKIKSWESVGLVGKKLLSWAENEELTCNTQCKSPSILVCTAA